jgi:hypothetical protein
MEKYKMIQNQGDNNSILVSMGAGKCGTDKNGLAFRNRSGAWRGGVTKNYLNGANNTDR